MEGDLPWFPPPLSQKVITISRQGIVSGDGREASGKNKANSKTRMEAVGTLSSELSLVSIGPRLPALPNRLVREYRATNLSRLQNYTPTKGKTQPEVFI